MCVLSWPDRQYVCGYPFFTGLSVAVIDIANAPVLDALQCFQKRLQFGVCLSSYSPKSVKFDRYLITLLFQHISLYQFNRSSDDNSQCGNCDGFLQ